MKNRLGVGSRAWIVSAITVVLIAAIAAVVPILTPRSQAFENPDTIAIQKVVAGYEMDTRTASNIPDESLSRVLDMVTQQGGRTAIGHILSQADKDAMNEAFTTAIGAYCTPDMAKSMGTDIGSVMDEALVAEAAHPAKFVVRVHRSVMAVEVERISGSEAYAWAYFWAGGEYPKGYGAQNWEVIEYRLLSDQGVWRIDNCRSLGILYPTSGSTDFGPYTSHDTVENLQMMQESQLAPGEAIPLDLLKNLEAAALSQK